jgi:hypothetical protein
MTLWWVVEGGAIDVLVLTRTLAAKVAGKLSESSIYYDSVVLAKPGSVLADQMWERASQPGGCSADEWRQMVHEVSLNLHQLVAMVATVSVLQRLHRRVNVATPMSTDGCCNGDIDGWMLQC